MWRVRLHALCLCVEGGCEVASQQRQLKRLGLRNRFCSTVEFVEGGTGHAGRAEFVGVGTGVVVMSGSGA